MIKFLKRHYTLVLVLLALVLITFGTSGIVAGILASVLAAAITIVVWFFDDFKPFRW